MGASHCKVGLLRLELGIPSWIQTSSAQLYLPQLWALTGPRTYAAECISTLFSPVAYKYFLVSFSLPPSYPFGFSHNYRLSPCDCMKGISSCSFFIFLTQLQPTSCFPLALHTHSLGGQHIMHCWIAEILQKRSDRGCSKQTVGKKSSAHWDLSSGKPSLWSPGLGTEHGEGVLSECKAWKLAGDLLMWKVVCSGYLFKGSSWVFSDAVGNYDPYLFLGEHFYWY